jgi:hypothetical protein
MEIETRSFQTQINLSQTIVQPAMPGRHGPEGRRLSESLARDRDSDWPRQCA